MYGEHVHKAVIESQETESGITIHYINENYDEGDVVLQARCPVRRRHPRNACGKNTVA